MKNGVLAMIAIVAAFAVSCSKNIGTDTAEPSNIRIEPVITRATSTNFEAGDEISVDIVKEGEYFASNVKMTYDATAQAFSSDQKWYEDGSATCSIRAFYPYQASGFPSSFTVASDQRGCSTLSDFMTASKSGIYPQENAVTMVFLHHLSQLVFKIDNSASATIESVRIVGIKPTAKITTAEDGTVSAAVDPAAASVDIVADAQQEGTQYRAIVVPQTASFGVAVKVSTGNTILSGISEVELKPGYSYVINVHILPNQVKASLSGEITAWQDGGSLDGGDYETPFEEFDGYFMYDGVHYNTVKLSNGRTWMAAPLAFVPSGATVSEDGKTGHVWYPYSSDGTNTTFLKDAASIQKLGYLYDYETLLGTSLADDNYTAQEGVRGICPKGWHIPTRAEYFELCGYSNKSEFLKETGPQTDENALMWDKTISYAPVSKFNEAGWNFAFSGFIRAASGPNALTITSSQSTVSDYYGYPRLTYIATSSASSKSTSGAYQMFALMTTFTGSAYPLGRVSLAYCAHNNGVQVRCIKDAN